MSDHADTIRRGLTEVRTPSPTELRSAKSSLDALLAENQQLRTEVEHLRDRAVCSGCGADVDESGICRYDGCDDGQMIPASGLPIALREACDAQSDTWAEWRFDWDALRAEAKGLEAENQRLRDALRNVDKLAAAIEAHEGHRDGLVCVEEMVATAAAIRVLAAVRVEDE